MKHQSSLFAFFGKSSKKEPSASSNSQKFPKQDSSKRLSSNKPSNPKAISKKRKNENRLATKNDFESAADGRVTDRIQEPSDFDVKLNEVSPQCPQHAKKTDQKRNKLGGQERELVENDDLISESPSPTNNIELLTHINFNQSKNGEAKDPNISPSPHICSDGTSSADESNSNDSDSDESAIVDANVNLHHHEKSEYEMLRERNIERNNARLKALGLMAGVDDAVQRKRQQCIDQRKKREAKRKKAADTAKFVAFPTRRSTRLSKPTVLDDELGVDVHEETTASALTRDVAKLQSAEEEEEFTVSPVVQYEMTSQNEESSCHSIDTHRHHKSVTACTTLIPRGPRLVPPSGLNAIYSLRFHPPSWESTNVAIEANNSVSWLVGAGKSGLVALWDCRPRSLEESTDCIEPVLSWKSHSGRWVADARFLPPAQTSLNENSKVHHLPSRLLTAANDGTVCLWDLTSTSVKTGAPKLLSQTNKALHSSGIFSMDAHVRKSTDSLFVTGSKDKTIAISCLERMNEGPLWRSNFHSAKVGSVCFSSSDDKPLVASASDDGLVGIHDVRLNGLNGVNGSLAAKIEDAHVKPHSAVWKPSSNGSFMTAGLDEHIKLWDLRYLSSPISIFHGHVPGSRKRLKRINRPIFHYVSCPSGEDSQSFILSGGEGSHSLSLFQLTSQREEHVNQGESNLQSVFSRGTLPPDVGDTGSLTSLGERVAVAVEGGEILMLSPNQ